MSYQLKLWDSKRERKLTGPNTLPAVRRTKGLSKSREELTGCRTGQPLRRQEAGGRGNGQARAPKTASPTTLQTGLQFLTKDFLRFWMVDIRREGRGETGRMHPTGAGGNWGWDCRGAGTAEGRRRAAPGESAPARQAPGCLSRSEGEGTKSRRSFLFRAFVEHPRAGTPRSA